MGTGLNNLTLSALLQQACRVVCSLPSRLHFIAPVRDVLSRLGLNAFAVVPSDLPVRSLDVFFLGQWQLFLNADIRTAI